MTRPDNYPHNPKILWDIFHDFTQTPRPSKREEKIQQYLIDLADKHHFSWKQDRVGNVCLFVPGKNGRENEPALLIQNHVDMVTDAVTGKNFDFLTQPIETFVENGQLKAKGTTLGADNGIGCAAALALALDPQTIHPPLELLFTMDEETGLNGALGLETEHLTAKKMLNLDTEEWGTLYVGCAGGIDYQFYADYQIEDISSDMVVVKLSVSGLCGGHSGLDIHEQRASGVKLISDFLAELNLLTPLRLIELRAGKAHNIIARDGQVEFAMDKACMGLLEELALKMKSRWAGMLPQEDQGLELIHSVRSVDAGATGLKGLSADDSRTFIAMAKLFPHGAHTYDRQTEDQLVRLSNNMAKLLLVKGKAYIQTSLRFFDRAEAQGLEAQLKTLAQTFAFTYESASEYPSWKPSFDGKLLAQVCEVYEKEFGKRPHITAIHAGLECGILKDKIGEIDVVSFGPTIRGAHSPDERVDIDSVGMFWQLLKKVVAVI